MRRVRFSQAAASDLEEIWNYLEEVAGSRVAAGILRDLNDRFELLAYWPRIGKKVWDAPGFRRFPQRPYVIFYRAIDVGIEVVRVVHQKRLGIGLPPE